MAQVHLHVTTGKLVKGSAKATVGLLLGRPSLVMTKHWMSSIGQRWPGDGRHQEPDNGLSAMLCTKIIKRAINKPSPGYSHSAASRWAWIWPWMFSGPASMCGHIFYLWFLSESVEHLAERFSVPPAGHRCHEDICTRTFYLFYNLLFPSISRSWDFCQNFTSVGIIKVWHLRHVSGCG